MFFNFYIHCQCSFYNLSLDYSAKSICLYQRKFEWKDFW